MKSQIIPISFLILSVSLILLGYLFYNLFYGTKYESYVFQVNILDAMRNVIESLKNYLQLSLVYSSHQALREHAFAGGMMPAGTWICNGPSPPSVEDSKACLEKYTTYYFNIYFGFYNTSLPVTLTKVNFDSCKYGIDENGALDGKYDEGYFWINCSKGKVSVSSKEAETYEELETDYYITKNRYWFMFRIFYEWAMANVYGSCICSCCLSCGDESCAQQCAKLAYEDLQNRFNRYGNEVKCKEPEKICLDHQFGGISCERGNECLDWEDSQCKCIGHFCEAPKQEWKTSYSPYTKNSSMINKYIMFSDKICEYWVENRLAATHVFTCEDHKYYIPSKKGPVPLTFTVHATAKFRCPDVCRNFMSCKYIKEEDKYICPVCPNNECI
jgi:hypothetical protein